MIGALKKKERGAFGIYYFLGGGFELRSELGRSRPLIHRCNVGLWSGAWEEICLLVRILNSKCECIGNWEGSWSIFPYFVSGGVRRN